MTSKVSSEEISIEFAINNALERILLLEGEDNRALLDEYKEWLLFNNKDIEVLFLRKNISLTE